jgi:hypothetical protein
MTVPNFSSEMELFAKTGKWVLKRMRWWFCTCIYQGYDGTGAWVGREDITVAAMQSTSERRLKTAH